MKASMARWLRATLSTAVAALVLLVAGAACISLENALAIELAMGKRCSLHSDCTAPHVCIFGRCHAECETDADCEGGGRCVRSGSSGGVCQLPLEKECDSNTDCAGDQVCADDRQCHDSCSSPNDCLGAQYCIGGACAKKEEEDLQSGALGESCTNWQSCPEDTQSTDPDPCVKGFCLRPLYDAGNVSIRLLGANDTQFVFDHGAGTSLQTCSIQTGCGTIPQIVLHDPPRELAVVLGDTLIFATPGTPEPLVACRLPQLCSDPPCLGLTCTDTLGEIPLENAGPLAAFAADIHDQTVTVYRAEVPDNPMGAKRMEVKACDLAHHGGADWECEATQGCPAMDIDLKGAEPGPILADHTANGLVFYVQLDQGEKRSLLKVDTDGCTADPMPVATSEHAIPFASAPDKLFWLRSDASPGPSFISIEGVSVTGVPGSAPSPLTSIPIAPLANATLVTGGGYLIWADHGVWKTPF